MHVTSNFVAKTNHCSVSILAYILVGKKIFGKLRLKRVLTEQFVLLALAIEAIILTKQ